MTIEEQLNQKQQEIHNLQMRLKNKSDLLDKIVEWLKVELDIDWLPTGISSNKTKDEALEDMANDDPLCYGRYECAKGLLNLIKEHEKKGEDNDEVYWC